MSYPGEQNFLEEFLQDREEQRQNYKQWLRDLDSEQQSLLKLGSRLVSLM